MFENKHSFPSLGSAKAQATTPSHNSKTLEDQKQFRNYEILNGVFQIALKKIVDVTLIFDECKKKVKLSDAKSFLKIKESIIFRNFGIPIEFQLLLLKSYEANNLI